MRVVAGRGIVFNVRSVDGDTTRFFFRSVIDLVECTSSTAVGFSQYGGDCSGQGSFTVVNVADGADVNVRFCTFKFSLDTAIFLTIALSPSGESTGFWF
ncbi:hypothetical protein SEEH1831_04052 [Salmonella enterica subsp. enterica serovar Heidelberg str. 77-1831]|nr:hypothetical protein SEEH1831_04052 [Salmonella enterica subsp. enterica serovar Heidelberg str. 77-1831]